MSVNPSSQGTSPCTAAPKAAARLRRLAAAVGAITCAVLALAAVIPAAWAVNVIPPEGGQ